MTQRSRKCICKGNWRNIVGETEHLLDRVFVDRHGHEYVFFGIVHASDDYYYGMTRKTGNGRQLILLSCVGDFSVFGYELTDKPSNV